jgi:hypothetical protein
MEEHMSQSKRKGRFFFAICLACLGSSVLAAPAVAIYDPIGSGRTILTVDRGFMSFLSENQVRLQGRSGVEVKGARVIFPVLSGKFDPESGSGTIRHEGSLVLAKGNRTIPFRALQLKTSAPRAPFSAKVGGGQLKLGKARGLVTTRSGFGEKISVGSLRLSPKVATRLAKKLRLHGSVEAGMKLGVMKTQANPETIAIEKQMTVEYTPDPAFIAKLDSHFVAVNPIFPAERRGSAFTFPIFDGKLAPNAKQGRLNTQGSLEMLQLTGGQLFWGEPGLELGTSLTAEADLKPSPPYPGNVGRVNIAALAGGSVESDPKLRQIGVTGATLGSDAATASALNELFAPRTDEFEAGEPLGTISFIAQGQ